MHLCVEGLRVTARPMAPAAADTAAAELGAAVTRRCQQLLKHCVVVQDNDFEEDMQTALVHTDKVSISCMQSCALAWCTMQLSPALHDFEHSKHVAMRPSTFCLIAGFS